MALPMTEANTPEPPGRQAPPPPAAADAAEASAPPAAGKPMVAATRITLFEREVRERLSGTALDLVLARAELLSEGQPTERNGRKLYFGSTMLTIDLPELTHVLRDACDAATARRLVTLMETDPEVPRRIRRIAEREAARVARAPVRDLSLHVTMRAQGARVFIDVDVEGTR
jgi:hypothetical protein